MPKLEQILLQNRLIPVVVLDDADRAVELAKALYAGGLSCIEVTLRTAAGLRAIERIAQNVPEVTVGAGTVLTEQAAAQAAAAGATFIVSPGFHQKVVSWCQAQAVSVVPGVSTPTEVGLAIEAGLSTVKFFPAEQSGGVAMLRALAAPYADIRFMPTGGITLQNLGDYLALPNVLACGGSWVCPQPLIAAGRFDEITALCKAAVKTMD